jgi:cytochrome P450
MSTYTGPIVKKATFRPATLKEVKNARGTLAWRMISYPCHMLSKVMGTLEVLWKGPNVLAWKTPILQSYVERFSYYIGYHPEQPFLTRLFTFVGDRYMIDDKKILDAFFRHHRNDEIFTGTLAMDKLFQTLKLIFPEDQLSKEDFMLTCSKDRTSFYQKILHRLLTGEISNLFNSQIQNIAKNTVSQWYDLSENENKINITQATRLFTSKIITLLMFNSDESSVDIAQAIDFISLYIVKTSIRKAPLEDQDRFNQSLKIYREAVEKILKKTDIPLFNENNSLTLAQKKAMVFLLFAAGQETTAALLNYILWTLAKNPESQEMIHQACLSQEDHIPEIDNYIRNALREFSPTYGVGRLVKEDICLEYTFKDEEKPRKYIFFKGEIVAGRIEGLAKKTLPSNTNYNDWHAFGSGVHRCPGEKLALQEVAEFMRALFSNYKIKTDQTESIPKVGLITTQLAEDIYIRMQPRIKMTT